MAACVLILQLSCWLWQMKLAIVVIVAKQCPESIDRLSFRVHGIECHAHVDQSFNTDVGDGGASVSLKPRRSGVMQRYPKEERDELVAP
ncbi:hypothetical protein PS2_042419 [Malus domestica]